MSRRLRNDSASINFSVNVPPEVIREYFDGMAKVETAKHPVPVATPAGFNWTTLIPMLAPLVVPFLTKSFESSTPVTPIRIPEPRCESRRSSEHTEGDKQPDIVISFVQKATEETQQKKAECEADTPVEEVKNEVLEDVINDKIELTESSKVEEEKKPKRPSYDEGENVMHLNLANLGAGLGGEGGGGLGEMMKMLGPMFQGLTSGLNGFGQLPVSTEASKPTSEVEGPKESLKQDSVLASMVSASSECSTTEGTDELPDKE